MRESKQEFAASEKYAREGVRAFPMGAMCANCGKPWARHCGTDCINGSTMTFALAEDATATMTPTMDKLEAEMEEGAKLIRRWAEKERARIQKERAEMLMPLDPNEPMFARDCTEAAFLYAEQCQEAERIHAILAAPASTAKPAISGLQRVYSNTHLLGSYR